MIGIMAYILWEASSVYQNLTTTSERVLSNSQQQALLTQSYATRLDATQLELLSVSQELDATRLLYQESQGLLGDVRVELALTKAVMADTESLLESAKAELASTKADLAIVEGNLLSATRDAGGIPTGQDSLAGEVQAIDQISAKARAEFEDTIRLLEEKNARLTEDMAKLQGQLTYLSADDVTTTQEGKDFIRNYKKEVKKVKAKLKHFKREARSIRQDAIAERDRIRMQLGNKGYFVKSGAPVTVDIEKFNNAGLDSNSPSINRKVEIDVTIVE